LREELSVRLLEKGVLRKILSPERDDGEEEWGRLHTEELYNLQSSPNTSRVINQE
jgi:hypothetical protein